MRIPCRWPILLAAILSTACGYEPSEQDLVRINQLQAEADSIDLALKTVDEELDRWSGGLIAGLLRVRRQVLLTTHDLIEQRIHALESGATITMEVPGTAPDSSRADSLRREMEQQREAVLEAEEEAEGAGGLIGALALATVATERQSLAMLRQGYLAAKYGLSVPALSDTLSLDRESTSVADPTESTGSVSARDSRPSDIAREILEVELLNKRFAEQDYEEYIWFDVQYTASGLDKSARAVKGRLHFTDLFGETQLTVRWTIEDPLDPGQQTVERGVGFEYNQFLDGHKWMRATEVKNMAAVFEVESILYEDGSQRNF